MKNSPDYFDRERESHNLIGQSREMPPDKIWDVRSPEKRPPPKTFFYFHADLIGERISLRYLGRISPVADRELRGWPARDGHLEFISVPPGHPRGASLRKAAVRNVSGNVSQAALTSASRGLHASLDGRAFFGDISVNLPDHWPDSCTGQFVEVSSGEESDFVIGRTHPIYGDNVWTQQSRGCGERGDFIYLTAKSLIQARELGESRTMAYRGGPESRSEINKANFVSLAGNAIVREWAKYRYGIFDELGYESDAVYPQCFHGANERPQVTGCSDKPIENVCSSGELVGEYNASRLVHPDATKSILFATTDRVTKFCDEKTHDAFAPTKQNLICNRRSATEVIMSHPDFAGR